MGPTLKLYLSFMGRMHSLGSPRTPGWRTWTTELPGGQEPGCPGTKTETTFTEATAEWQLMATGE